MNIKKIALSCFLATALSTCTHIALPNYDIDYKKHLLVAGYSSAGIYTALKSLGAIASSFVLADYQLQHDANDATCVAKHTLNIARAAFFGLASIFSFIQAVKLSKKSKASIESETNRK